MPVHFFHTLKSFTQFLWNWKLEGSPLVDQNTANLRAETCLSCHNNLPSGDVRRGCGVCNKLGNRALSALREQIIGKNSTPSDSKLLACAICGCDNKISVWIPNEVLLKKEEANAYPAFCWRKSVMEDKEL